MALTVSGSDADSYISLSDAETYATKHFIGSDSTAWDAAADADKEASLRQAAQYIDNVFREKFPGYIRSENQSLEWPRTNAWDRSGRHQSGIPQVVKDCQVELAKERIVAGDNLIPVVERGGKVKSETAGPISVTYEDNAPATRTYEFAKKILSSVLSVNTRGSRLARN